MDIYKHVYNNGKIFKQYRKDDLFSHMKERNKKVPFCGVIVVAVITLTTVVGNRNIA